MRKEIDYKELGSKIKSTRNNRHLTQEQLAELVQCNVTHISNVENNHSTPSLNLLFDIANALNTTIDYLLSNQYTNTADALDNAILREVTSYNEEKKEQVLRIIRAL